MQTIVDHKALVATLARRAFILALREKEYGRSGLAREETVKVGRKQPEGFECELHDIFGNVYHGVVDVHDVDVEGVVVCVTGVQLYGQAPAWPHSWHHLWGVNRNYDTLIGP
ncbi:MAG: hypothetical protein JWN50_629 [Parcubacteria group bacterium]|nr:hypothetical protein [Parcubacteria group bacterium]